MILAHKGYKALQALKVIRVGKIVIYLADTE
nr:MAG TPA: hypothetical protein [Caudoviricetes sp.]